MVKVGIAGGAGMLGSMVVRYGAVQQDIEILATVENEAQYQKMKTRFPSIHWEIAYVNETRKSFHFDCLTECDWIINAIGVIQPYLRENTAEQYRRAILINALLPFHFTDIASKKGARVLNIATDGVFAGLHNEYKEYDTHNENTLYAKSKSLGECPSKNFSNLRCSIIGPEYDMSVSLLEWFLHQKRNAEIKGFTNQHWNGITTVHFAKICYGIIHENIDPPNVQHIVPADMVTKASLLHLFAQYYQREDIRINEVESPEARESILGTAQQEWNNRLWQAAGYPHPPRIEQMVRELSQWS